MSKLKITHRITGATLFEGEYASTREMLEAAVKADANLAGAYLADAYLAGANLAGAYLAGAYLADANLARANLADANLARAYLAGANLEDANLEDANLADANLEDANLADARNVPDLSESATTERDTRPAQERYADRAAQFRERNPHIPVVPNLDAKILHIVKSGKGTLEMGGWHYCDTTHCRAGWAVHLAGAAGYELENKYGPQYAGTQIYRASTGRVPHFYASNERALADIREQAALQVQS